MLIQDIQRRDAVKWAILQGHIRSTRKRRKTPAWKVVVLLSLLGLAASMVVARFLS